LIFILGADLFSPELKDIYTLESAGLLLIFIIANAIANLAGIAFVALRHSEYYLIQNLLAGSKILLLLPLAYLGAFGIFGSVGISFILTTVFSSLLIVKSGIKHSFSVDKKFLAESFRFSLGNYLVGFFQTAPNLILPIMVLNILGADAAAYYYIAFSVAFILFIIPNAISTSLFVEGSNGGSLRQSTIRSSIAIYALLIPAVIILYFFGDVVLGLIGEEYAANGFELFRVMIFTSLFLPVAYVYSAVKRVQNRVRELVLLNGLIFALLVGLAHICMVNYGIVGIGYAWVISYVISVLVIGIDTLTKRISLTGDKSWT
jgi:O-antigen/teichoic acid export membrane protein